MTFTVSRSAQGSMGYLTDGGSTMWKIQAGRQGRGRAFTLIELLVVLAIVALLMTIAMPRYLQHVERSQQAVLRENLHVTRQVIDRFYGDKGRYPESLQELVDLRYLRTLPFDPLMDSDGAWTIVPVPEGYAGAVYDIHSSAPGNDEAGRPYVEW